MSNCGPRLTLALTNTNRRLQSFLLGLLEMKPPRPMVTMAYTNTRSTERLSCNGQSVDLQCLLTQVQSISFYSLRHEVVGKNGTGHDKQLDHASKCRKKKSRPSRFIYSKHSINEMYRTQYQWYIQGAKDTGGMRHFRNQRKANAMRANVLKVKLKLSFSSQSEFLGDI